MAHLQFDWELFKEIFPDRSTLIDFLVSSPTAEQKKWPGSFMCFRKAFRHLLVRKGVPIGLESAFSKQAAVVYEVEKTFWVKVEKEVREEHERRFSGWQKKREERRKAQDARKKAKAKAKADRQAQKVTEGIGLRYQNGAGRMGGMKTTNVRYAPYRASSSSATASSSQSSADTSGSSLAPAGLAPPLRPSAHPLYWHPRAAYTAAPSFVQGNLATSREVPLVAGTPTGLWVPISQAVPSPLSFRTPTKPAWGYIARGPGPYSHGAFTVQDNALPPGGQGLIQGPFRPQHDLSQPQFQQERDDVFVGDWSQAEGPSAQPRLHADVERTSQHHSWHLVPPFLADGRLENTLGSHEPGAQTHSDSMSHQTDPSFLPASAPLPRSTPSAQHHSLHERSQQVHIYEQLLCAPPQQAYPADLRLPHDLFPSNGRAFEER